MATIKGLITRKYAHPAPHLPQIQIYKGEIHEVTDTLALRIIELGGAEYYEPNSEKAQAEVPKESLEEVEIEEANLEQEEIEVSAPEEVEIKETPKKKRVKNRRG